MSGLVGALLHATNFRTAFLRTLIPSIGLAYGLQAACAIPSIIFQTERYYDLSGSLTYLSCTSFALSSPATRPLCYSRCSSPWPPRDPPRRKLAPARSLRRRNLLGRPSWIIPVRSHHRRRGTRQPLRWSPRERAQVPRSIRCAGHLGFSLPPPRASSQLDPCYCARCSSCFHPDRYRWTFVVRWRYHI